MGFQGRSTVLVCLRKHGTLDWTHSPKHLRMPNKETLAQTIKNLEQKLADGKVRNLILGKMVEALVGKHSASIRKKPPRASSGNSDKTV